MRFGVKGGFLYSFLNANFLEPGHEAEVPLVEICGVTKRSDLDASLFLLSSFPPAVGGFSQWLVFRRCDQFIFC